MHFVNCGSGQNLPHFMPQYDRTNSEASITALLDVKPFRKYNSKYSPHTFRAQWINFRNIFGGDGRQYKLPFRYASSD